MLTVSKKDLESVNWATMPMDKLAFGNAVDCDFTLRAYNEINKLFQIDGKPIIYEKILKDILIDFAKVEFTGIKVDVNYLSELEVQLKKVLEESEKICIELSPIKDIKLSSNQDLMVVLFSSSGFNLEPVNWSIKTKLPSVDADSLEIILAELHKRDELSPNEESGLQFIEALMEFRKRNKQYTTYVTNIKKAIDHNKVARNHPQYNFSTVVTGRLSCSNYSFPVNEKNENGRLVSKKKLKGVGFHTLPRIDEEDPVNIRKLFVADEGKLFITADFSTAELRMLAFLSNDANLKKAFISGADLHKYTASLIFSKPIDQITKEERQIAKSVSFLIVYGGGPKKLSMQIKKSLPFAKSVFSKFYSAFPNIPKWIEETRKGIRTTTISESLFGRKRHLGNVNSPAIKYVERALRQGVNHKIQSPVSDMLLISTYRINRMVEKTGTNLQTLANVHDSYEGQSTREDLSKSLLIIRKGMSDLFYYEKHFNVKFDVPFDIEIEVGKSFGDGKKVHFNENGSIINIEELLSI